MSPRPRPPPKTEQDHDSPAAAPTQPPRQGRTQKGYVMTGPYSHRPHVASCRRCMAEWWSATPEGARILADEHTRTSGHFCVLDVAS